ncbi:MAG: LysR family transcriptional regulator [Reinekea sp.]
MDNLQALSIFQRVSETLSFTKAASSLNLPRSTVTQAIQSLEGRLKVPLFVRTTRQVRLTEQGELVLQKAAQLLSDWDELSCLFVQNSQPGGKIRVSLPARLARLVILPALSDFHARYPDIKLDLHISDLRVDLIEQGMDLAFRAGPLPDSSLIARPIGPMAIKTLASPDYLARCGIPEHPDDLEGHQMVGFILPANGRVEPLEFKVNGQYQQRTLPYWITSTGTDAYLAAAVSGFGLVQVPAYGVGQQLASGELVEVMPDYPAEPLPLAMIYPNRHYLNKRLRLFMDWLTELFQGLI